MNSYNGSLTSMGHLKSVEFVRVKKNMYKTSKVMRSIEYTFLPCMFCFLNSDHMMFSRQFAFCLFINYAYVVTWMHVHKTKFEKKNVLWGTITWSEMGKENLQAKNVYSS